MVPAAAQVRRRDAAAPGPPPGDGSPALPGLGGGGSCGSHRGALAGLGLAGAMAAPGPFFPRRETGASPGGRSLATLPPAGSSARDTSEEEEGEGDEEEEEEEEEERAKEGQDRRRPPSKGPGKAAAQKSQPRIKKKKKYHRHAKPPYTYLAMIALAIQAAPERKLKLSQIIKEISTLFPFFKEGYQGWKDSVRHNLSSNDCFHKVLKDPTKPKAKGNFWTVDLDRIPREALKLQNTPISRQEEGMFAADLGPYVLHGLPLVRSPAAAGRAALSDGSSCFRADGARQSSPFSIDSLLSDFQDVGLCGKPGAGSEGPPPPQQHQHRNHPAAAGLDFWGGVPVFCVSAGRPVLPWRPPCSQPALRTFSSSSSLSSLSSLSAHEGEGGRPRGKKGRHPNLLPAKRPRGLLDPDSSGSDSESSRSCTPPPSLSPHWGQLPTSYTKSVAPNVVAPPSGAPPFTAFPALPSLPFCSPPAVALAGPMGWEVTPGGALTPAPPPPLSADLDHSMPPNKTVYDVWMTHPSDTVHPAISRPGPCLPGGVVAPYDPSWQEP